MAAIERLSTNDWPIAEINRRVGEEAERLGLQRPSYQQVRVLVQRTRRIARRPTLGDVVVEVAFRRRAPEAILDQVSGVGVPRIDR